MNGHIVCGGSGRGRRETSNNLEDTPSLQRDVGINFIVFVYGIHAWIALIRRLNINAVHILPTEKNLSF